MIVVMALVVTIVFVIVRVTPGDPAAVMLGPDATAADIAGLRDQARARSARSPSNSHAMSSAMVQGDFGQSIFLNLPVHDGACRSAPSRPSSSPCSRC